MDLYSFIIQNKEVFKLVYALIVILACFLIVLKTHKLFKISLHRGIRYFRNAFFFYGIAFAIRYSFSFFLSFDQSFSEYSFFLNILFGYFLIMAGFVLLYSLLWRKIDSGKKEFSSLMNSKMLIFYLLALIIVVLDYLWGGYYFMFFSQILVFIFATIISYSNYRKNKGKVYFPQFYFIAMVLSLFAWALNALAGLYFHWNQIVMINIYLFNMVFFLLFLYGVVRATRI